MINYALIIFMNEMQESTKGRRNRNCKLTSCSFIEAKGNLYTVSEIKSNNTKILDFGINAKAKKSPTFATNKLPSISKTGTSQHYANIKVFPKQMCKISNTCIMASKTRMKRKLDRLLRRMNKLTLDPSENSHQRGKSQNVGNYYEHMNIRTHSNKDLNKTKFGRTIYRNKLAERSKHKPLYSGEAIEKLINNDLSQYRDNKLTPKENLILASMRTTFLCSTFLRFQPVLNVFDS